MIIYKDIYFKIKNNNMDITTWPSYNISCCSVMMLCSTFGLVRRIGSMMNEETPLNGLSVFSPSMAPA